jgi:alpha-D-ribose 1-methylphosphonate 5-triphosphate synthase subunit PhnH
MNLRELIDMELSNKIADMLMERCNSQDKPLGRATATLALTLVAGITSTDMDIDLKSECVVEAIRFMKDLYKNGFDIETVN